MKSNRDPVMIVNVDGADIDQVMDFLADCEITFAVGESVSKINGDITTILGCLMPYAPGTAEYGYTAHQLCCMMPNPMLGPMYIDNEGICWMSQLSDTGLDTIAVGELCKSTSEFCVGVLQIGGALVGIAALDDDGDHGC